MALTGTCDALVATCRAVPVSSHPRRQGGTRQGGGYYRAGVGASHTPPSCRRLAHRIRKPPLSTATRATTTSWPTRQRARDRRIHSPCSYEGGSIDDSSWDPPSSPFFFLFGCSPAVPPLLPLPPPPRATQSRKQSADLDRALESGRVPSWTRLEVVFGKVRNSPPSTCRAFFLGVD